VEACSPIFFFNEGDEVTSTQLSNLQAVPILNYFRMMEDDYNDVDPVITITVVYEEECTPVFPFPCGPWLENAPDNVFPFANVVFGDQTYQTEPVEILNEEEILPNNIILNRRTFTYTIPLSQSYPTNYGLFSEQLRVTSHNLLGSPVPENVAFDFATRVTVLGDEVVSNPLWTTQAPTVPHLILRDPPGDESYAFLEEESTTCHGYGMSIGTESAVEAWVSAKIGRAGSVGIIAEAEYEVYAEISASLEYGVTRTSEEEYEMCFTSSSRYETNEEGGVVGDGDDVFISTATNYAYGMYQTLSIDDGVCANLVSKNELILSPLGTTNTTIYTQNHIQNNIIPELEENIATLDPNSAAYQSASDQLEVWQQAIDINNELKAEADFVTGTSFNGGPGNDEAVSVSTSEIKSLEMNMYIDASVAAEVGAEVGGTGVSGGVRVRARTDQGSSSSSTNQNTNTIGYHLEDDDAIDNFNVEIYSDKAFGTPVFVLDDLVSQSSCPYEGGYQIDQPLLTFEGGSSELTIENIPTGTQPTFQINVCNDSDEDRYYNLKVNPATNTQGAILQGFGENLSSTDFGFEILVPANGCINSATITLTQTSDETLDYEGIELYLYAFCQPASAPILSSIFLNAYFTDVTGLTENTLPDFKIYPNPSNGQFQIGVSGIEPSSFMSIYDLSGRVIYQEQIQTSSLMDVQLNSASPGMYLVEIQSPEGKRTKKITIQ
ncbi:MAG: T9SS type A sorting domain-containing protein, partial [Cryomorphaceae bacterium]